MGRLAICVVSYRRADITRRCLESLWEAPEVPYLVLLVDNGSPDAEVHRLLGEMEERPDVQVLRLPENRGPAVGRNVALSALPEDVSWVAMLDNDMMALRGWDAVAVRALESGADLVQPKLLQPDRLTVDRGPNRPNPSPLSAQPQFIGRGSSVDDPAVNREEDAEIAGTPIVKRQVFEEIGVLDERLHVAEDYDFSRRARAGGFSIRYVPDCALVHDHGFELGYEQERRRPEKFLSSHVVFWRRWRKAVLSPGYLAWYGWLHRHDEPMYLSPHERWSIVHRRLRRRLARWWIMSRSPAEWASEEEADRAAEATAARLSMGKPGL